MESDEAVNPAVAGSDDGASTLTLFQMFTVGLRYDEKKIKMFVQRYASRQMLQAERENGREVKVHCVGFRGPASKNEIWRS